MRNPDQSDLIEKDRFVKLLWIIRTDIDKTKIEKIVDELSKCQNNIDGQIEFIPLIEECERVIEYNRQSQVSIIYYQYLNNRTKKVPWSSLVEIFEQFKEPKTTAEIQQIMFRYNPNGDEEIDFDTFKLIIKDLVFFKELS